MLTVLQIFAHRKMPSGNSITNKIFGPIRHAIQGVADVDPERSRRDNMGKTKESIEQLEQARVVAAQDVKDASGSILQDLKRFQFEKEDDLKRYMVSCTIIFPIKLVALYALWCVLEDPANSRPKLAYAKSQIEWAKKNKETWEEAKAEIDKIDEN